VRLKKKKEKKRRGGIFNSYNTAMGCIEYLGKIKNRRIALFKEIKHERSEIRLNRILKGKKVQIGHFLIWHCYVKLTP
jgi:hypothetical protein